MNRIIPATIALLLAAAIPAEAETLSIALNADIRSTNPGTNRDDNTDRVILHVVEGLVGYREDGTVGPLLAERYDISADGKTYTFHLRHGVKFHNGAEMTSADVLWNWQRYLDPKTDWRCRGDLDGRNGLKIEAVEAPGADTVVMRINRPSALFLDTLARTDCGMAGILHKDSLNADGSWNKPIGTGPYRFGEWQRGQAITLQRFDAYVSPPGDKPDGYIGAKQPKIDTVRFVVVPDAAAAKAALLSGAIQIADITDDDVAELRKNLNVQVKTAPTAVKHTFLFQTRDPVVGNVKLRQAIAAALDIPELVASVSASLGEPNQSAVYTASSFHDAVQKQGYAHDLDKAKRLVKEAGYKGETIKIIANRRTAMPSYPAAVIAQAMLQDIGLKIEVEVLEWATQLDLYNKGAYQMMSFSYSARFDPALSYEQFAGNKDKQPRKVWDDGEALTLIERTSTVSDDAERRKLFDELHRRQLEQVPLIILYNDVDKVALAGNVRGYVPWVASKPRLWGVEIAR